MRILSPTVLTLVVCATAGAAQTQTLPAVRQLGAPIATSPKTFRLVNFVRALPNGRLLANDAIAHRLFLLDTSFQQLAIVADTGAGVATPYGSRGGGLLPFLADSSLFVDASTPAIDVIDPTGKVVRVMSLPTPRDVGGMTQSSRAGWPSTDARGRLIYRGAAPRNPDKPLSPGQTAPVAFPDSAPILRADLATRRVETIGWYKTERITGVRLMNADGTSHSVITNDPLPYMDDFAVLSDGTVAIIRGREYAIETIGPNGETTKPVKIPYPWEHLSDDAKIALMDSVKKGDSDTPTSIVGAGSTTATTAAGGAGLSASNSRSTPQLDALIAAYGYVKASELPDYRPAFNFGAVRPDARGNVWIRTLQPARSSSVAIYDIVTREGKLIDRVELPVNRSIVGFDTTSVYLVAREANNAWLERVKLH
jgi:hypothetical protein